MKLSRYLFILCFIFHSVSSSFQPAYGHEDMPNDNTSTVDANFYVQLATLGVIVFYALMRAGTMYCQYFHATCSDENGLRTGAAIRNFCCVGCCWCLPIKWVQHWIYDMDDEKTIHTLDDINRRYPPKQNENDIEAPLPSPIVPSLATIPPLQRQSSLKHEEEDNDKNEL